MERRESIAVIGSGIAGCLSARELADAGYEVTVLEQDSVPFNGTSAGAIQVHLGGLYSGNQPTARECLESAIAFKKALPFGINDRTASFLVAQASEVDLKTYTDFYDDVAKYYDSLPVEDHVFGPAETFYRCLDESELSFVKNIEGGITTQEPGLDIENLRSNILKQLGKLGVKIHTNVEVTKVESRPNDFELKLSYNGRDEGVSFDQVVNAAGYKARLLDYQLGDETAYNLYLKSWNIVKASRLLSPFYIVRGDFMHYSPIGDGSVSSLIVANDETSYIDTFQYDHNTTQLPDEWRQIMETRLIDDAPKRQQSIMRYATNMFLKDIVFEPVGFVPGIAVSYSASRQDRTKRSVNQVVPGWQTVIPTKVTNALSLAHECMQNARHYSDYRDVA